MVTLLTIDGVEEIDYAPSDAEVRSVSLADPGLYGMVLSGVTWIRRSDGNGFWTILAGRRVDVVPAALGWCWSCDGRGYWVSELWRVSGEVCAMYGMEVEDVGCD